VQRANFIAAIIYNVDSDTLLRMHGASSTKSGCFVRSAFQIEFTGGSLSYPMISFVC